MTAMMSEMAEPKFQSPVVRNCVSMMLPTRTYCPPPRSFGIKKLDTAGKNTSVMPEITPGSESGSVTQRRFSTAVEGGALLITLSAECEEQIGKEVPVAINEG